MTNKLFFLLFGISFFSCKGQDTGIITLRITNRSNSSIDSIVLPYKEIKIKNVEAGKTETVKIDVSQFNNNHEGVLPVLIYQNQRKFTGQFGFHDWGVFPIKEEHIYFFEKGINYKDEELKKPPDLKLFIVPKTSFGLDSIVISPAILKRKNVNSRFTELLLDYNLFEKEPEIKLYQKGKLYKIKIEHDWDNWNYNQEFIYVYDNGVVSKKEL